MICKWFSLWSKLRENIVSLLSGVGDLHFKKRIMKEMKVLSSLKQIKGYERKLLLVFVKKFLYFKIIITPSVIFRAIVIKLIQYTRNKFWIFQKENTISTEMSTEGKVYSWEGWCPIKNEHKKTVCAIGIYSNLGYSWDYSHWLGILPPSLSF